MARITNPFPVARPASPSILAPVARNFAPRIRVESAEEATRAAAVLADMKAGAESMKPTFRAVETKAPYEPVTPVVIPVKPQAGGSKT